MLFNFFKKFPFGLDISDYSIEILELKRRFNKFFLGAYGRVKLEKGIVKDGKILNKEKLKEKITELLKQTQPGKIKSNKVILSLPESKTFFHIFTLPVNLRGKELYNAVKTEALKTIPLEPKNIYFDFQVVSKKKVESFQVVLKKKVESFQEVLYVGIMKEIVDEYLEVIKGVGLELLVLDIESASLTRALKNKVIEERGVLIIDIGARTTTLIIVDKGLIRQSAIIPIAGDQFTKSIAKKLKVPLEEAEELKRIYGVDPQKGRVMFVLQKLIQEIFDKTKEIINFYEKQSKEKINKILLCGGSSLMPKLLSDFSSNFDIETKLADPWKDIEIEENIKKLIDKIKLNPVFFTNVIGLAKRGLEKDPKTAGINLIPQEKRNKNRIFKFFVVVFMIVAFIFLGWVIYNYILKSL